MLGTAIMRADFMHALDRPEDLEMRESIQQAPLLARVATETTQTALAHSISYAFTGRFGTPYGIACSFTLAEIARFNLQDDPEHLRPIADAFDVVPSQLPDALNDSVKDLGIAQYITKYLRSGFVEDVATILINPSRTINNIRVTDTDAALAIVHWSLQSFSGATGIVQSRCKWTLRCHDCEQSRVGLV